MRGASPATLFLYNFVIFRDIFDEPDLENTELLQVFFIGFVHMPLIIDVLSAGGVEMRRYIKGIYLALSHMHKDCIM